MIPYASRTVDIILHPDCPLPKKGAKDVINLLKARELSCLVEAVVQMAPERYRLTFNHARQMHAFSNQDFSIHGKPVEFRTVSPFTWVYVSRLPYGIPDEAITNALAPYSGGIKSIKSVLHEKIYTGEHNILMKITANIPARLRIAGHWCVVKYSGQKPVCFKCHKEGHVIADCPSYQNTRSLQHGDEVNNSNNATHRSNSNNTEPSVPVAPSRPVASYAAVAARNHPQFTPSESTNGSSTPINNHNKNNNQSASDYGSGAPAPSAPSVPSGRGSTVDVEPTSSAPFSPVRRRGKRRHSPINSPQPEEKRATHDDVADDDANLETDPVDDECSWSQTSLDQPISEPGAPAPSMANDDTESRPEDVPLPQDDDDDDDNADDNETDTDNDKSKHTDGDDDDDNGPLINDDINEDDDDKENDDIQDTDEDPMDPEDYLDFAEDEYPSDDAASFATVSEAELPNSPAPRLVKISFNNKTKTTTLDEPACAVAQDADALFKLAAVLPTQGGTPSD